MKYRKNAQRNVFIRLLVITFCSIILIVVGLRWQHKAKLTRELISTHPQGFLVQWHGKTNEIIRYKTTQEGQLQISGPVDLQFKHWLETTVKLLIKEQFADNTAILSVIFESAKTQITLPPNQVITYDSSTDPSNLENDSLSITFKPLASLIGQQFEIKIAANGKILEAYGLEEIQNNLLKDYKNKTIAQTALGSSLEIYSPPAILHMIESATYYLPDNQINVGDTWETTSYEHIPLIGQVALANNYVLKGPDLINGETCLGFSYHGLPSLEQQSATSIFPPNSIKDLSITLESGDVFGYIYFSPSRGLLLKKSLNLDLQSTTTSKLTGISIPDFLSIPVVIPGQEPTLTFKQHFNLHTITELL